MKKKVLAAALGGAVLLGGGVFTATQAQAASTDMKCRAQSKILASSRGEIEIKFDLCVLRSGNMHRAAARHIQIHTRGFSNPPNLVNKLVLTVRLERNNVTQTKRNFDWKTYGNRLGVHKPSTQATNRFYGGQRGGWTADGVVTWAMRGGGSGKWQLVGTGKIA